MRVLAALLISVTLASAQTGASLTVRLSPADREHARTAMVSLWPGQPSQSCDVPGIVTFSELAAGDYHLTVAGNNFVAADTALRLETGETRYLPVILQKVVLQLPEVNVETEREEGLVRTYDRQSIDASGARSLPDFLRRSAGVDVQSDGTTGAVTTIRIGGSSANQVLVLVDGRRLQQVGSGEADLSSIPLEWVETVRIHRGSNPEAGGEAIGGILEISTRHPASRTEVVASSEVRSTSQRVSFQRTGQMGPIGTVLALSRLAGPGDFTYTISEDDGTGTFTPNLGQRYRRVNAGITRDQILLKFGSNSGDRWRWDVSGSLDRAIRGMPGYLAPQLTPEARQSSHDGSVSLRLERTQRRFQFDNRVTLQNAARTYDNPDPLSPVHHSDESSRQWDGELRFASSARRGQWSGGVTGGTETLQSSQIASGSASRTRWAAWSRVHRLLWGGGRQSWAVRLEPGLRVEGFRRNHSILPRAALQFDVDQPLQYGVSAAWGRSYRAPTLYSLFWLDDQVSQGNPDLRPESSAEWTARTYVATSGYNARRLDLAVSDQWVEDLIFWQRSFDNRWKPFNLKRAHVRDLDLTLEQRLWNDHVRFSGGLNWTEARDASGDHNTDNRYLTLRAPRTQHAAIHINIRDLSLDVSHRRVAARPVTNTNSKWLRPYEITDMRASWQFHWQRFRIEPALGVDNLFAENYRIVRYAPMPGREFFASVTVTQP